MSLNSNAKMVAQMYKTQGETKEFKEQAVASSALTIVSGAAIGGILATGYVATCVGVTAYHMHKNGSLDSVGNRIRNKAIKTYHSSKDKLSFNVKETVTDGIRTRVTDGLTGASTITNFFENFLNDMKKE